MGLRPKPRPATGFAHSQRRGGRVGAKTRLERTPRRPRRGSGGGSTLRRRPTRRRIRRLVRGRERAVGARDDRRGGAAQLVELGLGPALEAPSLVELGIELLGAGERGVEL